MDEITDPITCAVLVLEGLGGDGRLSKPSKLNEKHKIRRASKNLGVQRLNVEELEEDPRQRHAAKC